MKLKRDILRWFNRYINKEAEVSVDMVANIVRAFNKEFGEDLLDMAKNSGIELRDSISGHFKKRVKSLPSVDYSLNNIRKQLDLGIEKLYNINMDIAEQLRDQLLLTIVSGGSKDGLLNVADKIIDRAGVNYETLYRTYENGYYQLVERELAKELGYDGLWVYVGAPLQDNSHPECVWVLEERGSVLFTKDEMERFEAGTYPEHLIGRSAVRYNCQHYFVMKGD